MNFRRARGPNKISYVVKFSETKTLEIDTCYFTNITTDLLVIVYTIHKVTPSKILISLP